MIDLLRGWRVVSVRGDTLLPDLAGAGWRVVFSSFMLIFCFLRVAPRERWPL